MYVYNSSNVRRADSEVVHHIMVNPESLSDTLTACGLFMDSNPFDSPWRETLRDVNCAECKKRREGRI